MQELNSAFTLISFNVDWLEKPILLKVPIENVVNAVQHALDANKQITTTLYNNEKLSVLRRISYITHIQQAALQ